MAQWYARSAWTDEPNGFARYPDRELDPEDVEELVLHYPGVATVYGSRGAESTFAALRGFRRFHVQTRGWADIGYCWAVDQAGRIVEAAGDRFAAAHSATPLVKDANYRKIGVLLIIGNHEKPSAAMIESVRELRAHLRKRYKNMRRITGHRRIRGASTSCPGAHVINLLDADAFDGAPRPSKPAPSKPVTTPKPTPPRGGDYSDHKVDGVLGPHTVRSLQRFLSDLGFDDHAEDGELGPYTIRDLQRFLRSKGFEAHAIDGKLGPFTVKSLQRYLIAAGHDGHDVDGVLGPYTIRSLQRRLLAA